MTAVPVSPAVLKWARTFRGLDEVEAAARLGISVTDLIEYEDERAPKPLTLTLFEKCAAQYQLPTATLFRLTPPSEPRAPEDFRTLDGLRPKDSFEFRTALSDVRVFLHEIRRLAADDDEFAPTELPQCDLRVDPERLARDERARLGITVEQQLGWRASEGFRRWRAVIEGQRIAVFLKKFPLDDCRGFTLFDDPTTPAIIINKSEWAETARTFTLVHEYCHLLIRRPGISDQNNRSPIEAYCNKFASAFLMPPEALRAVLPYWPNEPIDWDKDDIEGWALRLKVSQRALALRLEQLAIAPPGFYKKFAWPIRKRAQAQKGSGGNYVLTRLSEIGGRYTDAIIGALDRGVISQTDASQALGLSPRHFDSVRESIARQRALTGAD